MSGNTAIIVAGGSGSRMKSSIPKQFLLLNGVPILVHTVKRFLEFDPDIHLILVLPESNVHFWEEAAIEHKIAHHIDVTVGGESRFQSVKNGLELVQRSGVIGIHDGVRPLVSKETLERCYNEARIQGNAIPSLPVEETIREIKGDSSLWVNRENYRIIQTPQCFDSRVIQNAYNQPYSDSFTDDASVVETNGITMHLVDGNRENIKVTRPEDLELAGILIQAGK